jgi:hypothetical protein
VNALVEGCQYNNLLQRQQNRAGHGLLETAERA